MSFYYFICTQPHKKKVEIKAFNYELVFRVTHSFRVLLYNISFKYQIWICRHFRICWNVSILRLPDAAHCFRLYLPSGCFQGSFKAPQRLLEKRLQNLLYYKVCFISIIPISSEWKWIHSWSLLIYSCWWQLNLIQHHNRQKLSRGGVLFKRCS